MGVKRGRSLLQSQSPSRQTRVAACHTLLSKSLSRPPQTIGIFQSYSQFMIRRFISLPFNMFFSLEAVVVFLDAT
jgi:hypothetical protein